MSDLGSEMGSAGVSAGSGVMLKLLEGILAIINKIYETFMERTSAEYKLAKLEVKGAKLELKAAKSDAEMRAFVKAIDGKTGFVNHNDLVKAGIPLTATGVKADEREFREMCGRCKREGITISALGDMRERERGGQRRYVVVCKSSDLARFAELADVLNEEAKLKSIDKKIDEIRGKGKLTDGDSLDIANFEKEKQKVRDGHTYKMNDEQAAGVTERGADGETRRGVSFDEALNRYTGGYINEGTTTYIADAKNPSNYIECRTHPATFRDREYIKTDYTVYKEDKEVYTTHDGRFEGRRPDYWPNEKAAMRREGNLGDLVLKFSTLAELQAYREAYRAKNDAELDVLEQGSEGRDYDNLEVKATSSEGTPERAEAESKEAERETRLRPAERGREVRDYNKIIDALDTELSERGLSYKYCLLLDKITEAEVTLSDDMSVTERANYEEATVIAHQISNYRDLSNLEVKAALVKTDMLTSAEGTPERAEFEAELDRVNVVYAKAIIEEAKLIEMRKSYNFVQPEQETRLRPAERGREVRDYNKIIDALGTNLSERGLYSEFGRLYDKDTKAQVTISDDMSAAERFNYGEATVITHQIDNYEQLIRLEAKAALAKVDVITSTEGTPVRAIAEANLNSIDVEYAEAISKEAELIERRKSYNAIKSEHETRLLPVAALERESEGRDYNKIIAALYTNLSELGLSYKNGWLFDKDTKAQVTISDDMSAAERFNYGEAAVITHQIDNYRQLRSLEVSALLIKHDLLRNSEGTLERAKAEERLNSIDVEYAEAISEESKLLEMRNSYINIKSEKETRPRTDAAEAERGGADMGEHLDDRRDERIGDADDRRRSMDEYKGEIDEMKINEGAKGADLKDRGALDAAKAVNVPEVKDGRE